MTTRKKWDRKLGSKGEEFESEMKVALTGAGLEVLVPGFGLHECSPSDCTFMKDGKRIALQLSVRMARLEIFSTIHVPDQNLTYDFYVAKSNSGAIFLCSVEDVKRSTLTLKPNKYSSTEKFYDVPIRRFAKFFSVKDFASYF